VEPAAMDLRKQSKPEDVDGKLNLWNGKQTAHMDGQKIIIHLEF